MWSLGVVWMELLTGNYLLESDNVIEQILKIFKTVGSPNVNLINYSRLKTIWNYTIIQWAEDFLMNTLLHALEIQ